MSLRKGDNVICFLGIDTSCYTTSLAVWDGEGRVLADKRKGLPVGYGSQGLRQSTALFYHLRNLPLLMDEIFQTLPGEKIKAVAASAKPRPVEDSYMPVFTAGVSLAQYTAALLKIPLYLTTHQEGHLVAGLWSAGCADLADFLLAHLSGGTTEILRVKQVKTSPLQYDLTILGGSSDLQAGQLIDRIGVAMGLPFPCGPHLEQLAAQSGREEPGSGVHVVIPSAVRGMMMSFSGAETRAKQYLQDKAGLPEVAKAVERCIAVSVEKALRKAIELTGLPDVVLVGGVAANAYIRERLQKRLEHRAVGARLHFAEPQYCTDNAVGVSIIASSIILQKIV